jgi:glutathione S-transferase
MGILEAIYANADRRSFVGSGCRSLMVTRRQLARLADSIPAADRERWSPRIEIDLAKWPNLKAYVDRVAARPKVQEAMKTEGLLQ